MPTFTADNLKWLIGTLAIPAALGFVSYEYQKAQAEHQLNDARLRLYTELLSKREEADTSVRRGIFDKVLDTYLKPGGEEKAGGKKRPGQEKASGQDLEAKLVALELLAVNFHDSLDLSPLFWQLDREVERSPQGKQEALATQLKRIAEGVKDRQIEALEVGGSLAGASRDAQVQLSDVHKLGQQPVIDADFSFEDPDPFAPKGRKLQRHLTLSVIAHDAARRRIFVVVQARGAEGQERQWGFWVDAFDFPMVNFTRLSRSERFTVLLQRYDPPSAKVTMIYFPSARIGAKDKPFIDDVISDLVHEKK